MLILILIGADWTAWYDTQVKLRSQPPKAEHQRWMAAAVEECGRGDSASCAYMLTFRTFDLRALIDAADLVVQKCNDGDRTTCEAALKVAAQFPVVYYDHRLGLMKDRFPQDIFKATCLRFGSHCNKFDLKACRGDKRCTLTEEEVMLIELRQGQELEITEAAIRAVGKECADGVANCRPKDMALFKRDCPSGPGCFIACYDTFLRTSDTTHESEMYGVLPSASKETPTWWLSDARIAQCLRGKGCEDKKLDAKSKGLLSDLKGLHPKAVNELNVYTHPATAIVVNELVEAKVQGNAKLAAAMAALESKRAELTAARKQKARETTVKAQLPAPRTATQSAMYTFIQEREAEIAESVQRYE